ncbi:trihelix transcription factor GT-2-like [Senna tora]|uniref:Trihelix transcription factor GT-2-like n=1 Tax=Senna tora TaxID=362788 RepID=A0A834X768_9FABA|nr:trihelix transcription factor GT-2-like [Senna tora]
MVENSSLPEDSIKTHHALQEGFGGPVSDGFKGEHAVVSGDSGGRWPPEETMALLKIRSDMDVAFRDSTPKAPLWEQVSRRLEELGYNRNAKKCKEKFENIYKYHRRTKEGRFGRSNGKTYRFFEQLESLLIPSSLEKTQGQLENTEKSTTPMDVSDVIQDAMPCSIRFPCDPSSSTTSSSSKEPIRSENMGKKKRKMTQFFESLMKEVTEKQEKLQKNFMEMLEKCEQDRIAREEAWKMQELARIKRDRELLAQERSIAAAKDAAVLAFLKKFTEQEGSLQFPENVPTIPSDKENDEQDNVNDHGGNSIIKDKQECGNGGNFTLMSSSSSRWPKDEVEALIRLRTNFDVEYEGNGPKGSLWEEISNAMKKLGYDRSAKKCKEKWENMNKYFKRMKEKNKKKPDDSKTCPYFHQLDALYSEKPKKVDESASSDKDQMKPEELLMHIMGGQSSSEDADMEKEDQNQIEGGSAS